MSQTIRVTIRYSQREIDWLEQLAKELGFETIAQYIRSRDGFEIRNRGAPEGNQHAKKIKPIGED